MMQAEHGGLMAADAGTRVTLRNTGTEEVSMFVLVHPGGDVDPAAGRISVGCPLAQGILRHKAGETVSVPLLSGAVSYEILAVEPVLAG